MGVSPKGRENCKTKYRDKYGTGFLDFVMLKVEQSAQGRNSDLMPKDKTVIYNALQIARRCFIREVNRIGLQEAYQRYISTELRTAQRFPGGILAEENI